MLLDTGNDSMRYNVLYSVTEGWHSLKNLLSCFQRVKNPVKRRDQVLQMGLGLVYGAHVPIPYKELLQTGITLTIHYNQRGSRKTTTETASVNWVPAGSPALELKWCRGRDRGTCSARSTRTRTRKEMKKNKNVCKKTILLCDSLLYLTGKWWCSNHQRKRFWKAVDVWFHFSYPNISCFYL